jgi:hypothetical protein
VSSKLRIHLFADLRGRDADAGIVARIIPAGDETPGDEQQVVIPIGSSTAARDVVVPPGWYVVEARLPSGAHVRQNVRVAEGEVQDVGLRLHPITRSGGGWQQVTSQACASRRDETSTAAHETSAPPEARALFVERMSPRTWERLADAQEGRRRVVASDLESLLRPVGGLALVGSAGPDDDGWTFTMQHAVGGPDWKTVVMVRRAGATELVALPIPWRTRGEDAEIEIAVPCDASAPIAVAVADPDFGTLVGYLGAGAIDSAGRLLERGSPHWGLVEALMDRKIENPFAAAAAACVLVQGERSGERQDWDAWIERLATWHEWFPDGQVLLGVRRLRTATSPSDVVAAREAFETAIRAGVPVLAPIARLLLDGVTTIVGDPDFESGSLDQVVPSLRAVMLRLDRCQPFTVLRFLEGT